MDNFVYALGVIALCAAAVAFLCGVGFVVVQALRVHHSLDGLDERADLAFEGLKMQREGAEALKTLVDNIQRSKVDSVALMALAARVSNLEPKDCPTEEDASCVPSRSRTLSNGR